MRQKAFRLMATALLIALVMAVPGVMLHAWLLIRAARNDSYAAAWNTGTSVLIKRGGRAFSAQALALPDGTQGRTDWLAIGGRHIVCVTSQYAMHWATARRRENTIALEPRPAVLRKVVIADRGVVLWGEFPAHAQRPAGAPHQLVYVGFEDGEQHVLPAGIHGPIWPQQTGFAAMGADGALSRYNTDGTLRRTLSAPCAVGQQFEAVSLDGNVVIVSSERGWWLERRGGARWPLRTTCGWPIVLAALPGDGRDALYASRMEYPGIPLCTPALMLWRLDTVTGRRRVVAHTGDPIKEPVFGWDGQSEVLLRSLLEGLDPGT